LIYFYIPAKNPEMRQSIWLVIILLSLNTFVAGQHYSPGRNEADPDWLELRARPEYADDEILCGITNIVLSPAECSQI